MKDLSFHLQGSKKKGVILVHGLTGAPAEMKFVGKQLNRMGFTVTAPMLAGHCQDIPALLKTHYEDWVESVRVAIRAFKNEVDEVYIAGICVGGALGLLAAHLEEPTVKGVAIYSPAFSYDGWSVPFYYPWAEKYVRYAVHVPFFNRLTFGEAPPYGIKSDRIRNAVVGKGDGIEGTLPAFPMKSLNENSRLNDALKKALPHIKIPTLLIHAREDDICHPRNSDKIKKLHSGECKIEYLEDSYHLIHVDQEYKKTAQLTADFFGVPEQTEQHAA